MTSIPRKGGEFGSRHTYRHKHYVKMEPEITMILPQDKKCPRLSVNRRKPEETMEQFFLTAWWQLDLGALASKTMTHYISVLEVTQFMYFFNGSLSKFNRDSLALILRS